MSEENVEIVRRFYDAFNEGWVAAAHEFLDADVVFKEAPEQPGATTFRGLEAVIEGFGKWSENWESHRIEPERLVDLGDRVLALEHHVLRGRDGIEVDGHAANTWTLRDGKIVRFEPSWDPAAALKAAGLSE